jgi:hypothetical protein
MLPVAALVLLAGCQDRTAANEGPLAADSSLARDLALAQRNGPGPVIFNDAPLDAPAPASPAAAAPAPRSAPPRATAPAPRPVARPQRPPATASPRTPEPADEPAPGPAHSPSAGVIGAGARVGLATNGRVCAATALAGDKFTATVTSATTGSNGAVIPAGSVAVLEIASVDRADPLENSRITFRVRSIDIDGESRPASGDVATLGALEPVQGATNNAKTKVIGGAVAGAVLGRILGGSTKATVIGGAVGAAAGTAAARRGQTTDACLPNGTALQLTLSRDMTMRTASGF